MKPLTNESTVGQLVNALKQELVDMRKEDRFYKDDVERIENILLTLPSYIGSLPSVSLPQEVYLVVETQYHDEERYEISQKEVLDVCITPEAADAKIAEYKKDYDWDYEVVIEKINYSQPQEEVKPPQR